MKKLWELLMENYEESAIGLWVGLVFAPMLSWTILFVPGSCMILWRMGGSDHFSKLWRRIGVPCVLGLAMMIGLRSWIPALAILPAWLMIANGYGIPSFNGPFGSQDCGGSPIGKFVWYVIFRQKKAKNEAVVPYVNLVVRTIYAGGIALAWIPVAWIPGNVGRYIVGAVLLTLGIPLIVLILQEVVE
jgi:hypothetical protein